MPPIAKGGMLGMLSGAGGGAGKFWTILDRATGALPDTGTFEANNYLMVLGDFISASGGRAAMAMLENDVNSGGKYSVQIQDDGGASQQYTGGNGGVTMCDTCNTTMFGVGVWSNIATQEKLFNSYGVNQAPDNSTSGIPERRITAGKFAETTNQITSIKGIMNTGSLSTDSEIVVLGLEGEGDNAWELLAEVDVTSGTPDTIDSGTIEGKKYMMIEFYGVPTASGNIDCSIQFNGVSTGTGYLYRLEENGSGTERTSSGTGFIACQFSGTNSPVYMQAFILNKDGEEKLVVFNDTCRFTAGSGTASRRNVGVGKSTNTDLITSIQIQNNGGGSYDNGFIRVWGFD